MTRKRFIAAAILFLALLTSCGEKADVIGPDGEASGTMSRIAVAVVAPIGDAATKARMERTAQWFTANLREAQGSDTLTVAIQIEWHDELSEDLEALSRSLASRNDIVAVIGPFANENMALFALACQKTHKPLIAPTTTSEDIMRRYAVASAGTKGEVNKEAFFWPLCESDVELTETMIQHYLTWVSEDHGQRSCAVFSPADKYGQTFYDWAPFYTSNMNVSLLGNVQYTSTDDLLQRMKDFLDNLGKANVQSNCFCVTETTRQLLDVAQLQNLYRTYFVFPSLSEEGLAALGDEGVKMLQGYQGFMPYADPATGFEKAYEAKFGVRPTFAECKFYDALLLTALASSLNLYIETIAPDFFKAFTPNETMNGLIQLLGKGEAGRPSQTGQPLWQGNALKLYLTDLQLMSWPMFYGASGYIVFDPETCMQIAHTTYLHWQIDNGQIRALTYYGPNGKEVVNTSVSWESFYDEETASKDFDHMAADKDLGIAYPALTGQYAVLVQGSNGMNNYRHQADVLSVYQLLRQGGFDDDHIILILDGALANDPQNDEPGIIRCELMGHDLLGGTDALRMQEDYTPFTEAYPAAVADYDTDTLSATDIADIMLGRQSDHLPVVLPPDAGQNVLLYWSGHGRSQSGGGYDELVWREMQAGMGMTATLLRQTVEQMTMRKLLVILEPCYSEAIIRPLEGLTGVLAIAGASGNEQSFAENWNTGLGQYGTWMCDRFTRNVVRCLTNDVSTTYRDLYLYCQKNTLGSHVKIVNAERFGNLYKTSPEEFVRITY